MENTQDSYMPGSDRFNYDGNDAKKIAQVFAWSFASSILGAVGVLIPLIHVPAQYAAVAAVVFTAINTGAVAAKKYLDNKGKLF